jgi:hypothetical protein
MTRSSRPALHRDLRFHESRLSSKRVCPPNGLDNPLGLLLPAARLGPAGQPDRTVRFHGTVQSRAKLKHHFWHTYKENDLGSLLRAPQGCLSIQPGCPDWKDLELPDPRCTQRNQAHILAAVSTIHLSKSQFFIRPT